MSYIIICLSWFLLWGAITAAVAKSRNHDPVIWFFFGGALFIIALPVLLLSQPGIASRREPHKGCPYCSAQMSASERTCPSCGRSQPTTAASSQKNWEEMIARENEQ